MWCNFRQFYGKQMWLFFFLALWLFHWNWPLVIFLFFVVPWFIRRFWDYEWAQDEHRKRKNDDDGDYWYGEDDEKPKRRPIYVRTSDGEFVELSADEYEYV